MKKLLFLITLLLMFSVSVYAEYEHAQYEKENMDKTYANRTKILKANNLVSYKGKTKIKVDYYNDGYAYHPNAEAGEDNIGKTYDTYIDTSDESNITIIISKSKHNKELKINIRANEMTLIYDGKEILVHDKETAEQAAKEIPLYKYPKTIVVNLYSYFIYLDYHKKNGYDSKATNNIISITDIKSSAESYINEIKRRITDKDYGYGEVDYGVDFNNNYEIGTIYSGDNSESYTWKDNSIVSMYLGTMGESIEIEFLEPKGWIRK